MFRLFEDVDYDYMSDRELEAVYLIGRAVQSDGWAFARLPYHIASSSVFTDEGDTVTVELTVVCVPSHAKDSVGDAEEMQEILDASGESFLPTVNLVYEVDFNEYYDMHSDRALEPRFLEESMWLGFFDGEHHTELQEKEFIFDELGELSNEFSVMMEKSVIELLRDH